MCYLCFALQPTLSTLLPGEVGDLPSVQSLWANDLISGKTVRRTAGERESLKVFVFFERAVARTNVNTNTSGLVLVRHCAHSDSMR